MSSTASLILVAALVALVGVAAVAVATAVSASRRRTEAAAREAALQSQLAASNAGARTEEQVLEAFRSLAGQALRDQSQQFVALADSKYEQLQQSAEARWQSQSKIVLSKLGEYQRLLSELDRGRQSDSSALQQAVADLKTANDASRRETAHLASALRDGRARGSWGELQLRRVLEHAGMLEHVDFVEQAVVAGVDQGGRPDVIVRLPNGRAIVIDAKAPLDRFLLATEEDDPDRRQAHLDAHGKAVHDHATALSRRRYDDVVDGAIDLVVMFIPGEAFLSAAFEARPTLLEDGLGQRIVVASPTSLMGLLRAVALGWREQRVAEQAEQIALLGRELHERIAMFAEHLGKVGGALDRAVSSYNAAVGSFESRVLVSARRFEDLGAASTRALTEPPPVDIAAREVAHATVTRAVAAPTGTGHASPELSPSPG